MNLIYFRKRVPVYERVLVAYGYPFTVFMIKEHVFPNGYPFRNERDMGTEFSDDTLYGNSYYLTNEYIVPKVSDH